MGFGQAVDCCLRRYFTFSGRASRPEYWYFFLFMVLGSLALERVEALVGIESGALSGLFSLLTVIPSLSAGWRRMHDTGRSGLSLLYPLVVFVGILGTMSFFGGLSGALDGQLMAFVEQTGVVILALSFLVLIVSPLVVLFWLTRPGTPGTNKYGPPPGATRQV